MPFGGKATQIRPKLGFYRRQFWQRGMSLNQIQTANDCEEEGAVPFDAIFFVDLYW
jgi:hypothetical protein